MISRFREPTALAAGQPVPNSHKARGERLRLTDLLISGSYFRTVAKRTPSTNPLVARQDENTAFGRKLRAVLVRRLLIGDAGLYDVAGMDDQSVA